MSRDVDHVMLMASQAIDTITLALSAVSALELADENLGGEAHARLVDARRALTAKYPNGSYRR